MKRRTSKKQNKSFFIILVLLIGLIAYLLFFDKNNLKEIATSVKDSSQFSQFSKKELTIGTFNIEWLGDGYNDRKPREEEDYRRIADVINDSGADILGLQEIENKNAIKQILKYLPEYDFIIGQMGQAQKLALLYKKELNIKELGEYTPISIDKKSTRPGLLVYAKAGNFDFYLMVVHFKSTSRWDNTPEKQGRSMYLRKAQTLALRDWADSVLNLRNEMDLIVVGDFNDTPKRKKNNILNELNEHFIFLTENEKSCKMPNAFVIDHIIVSDEVHKRYVEGSLFVHNLSYRYSKYELQVISDHCPITVKFDLTMPDNDPPKPIAKK